MKHLTIGGSTASRTLNCTAWVSRSKDAPKQPGNKYAHEGNLLHDCMEEHYMTNVSFAQMLSEGREYNGIKLDVDMIEDQLSYAYLATEKVLDTYNIVDFICEPFVQIIKDKAGGSIDFLGVSEDGKTVLVLDYKFGRHEVPAEGNSQLQFYATAARIDKETKDFFDDAEKVVYAIVQPKVSHAADVWESDVDELDAFEVRLREAITEVEKGGTAKTGSHCQYCPVGASGQCPEKNQQARSALILNPKQADSLAECLQLVEELQGWIKEVENTAHGLMDQGAKIPGFKLVDKRAMRKWADAEKAEAVLVPLLGDDAIESKFRTPAQVEKLIKKAKLDVDIDEFIIKVSSGTTVVPESDKRDAVEIPEISDALNKLVDSSQS